MAPDSPLADLVVVSVGRGPGRAGPGRGALHYGEEEDDVLPVEKLCSLCTM